MTPAATDEDTARRNVLNNYRHTRGYATPPEAIRDVRNVYARSLAQYAVQHRSVHDYLIDAYAAAQDCYDRIWARIDADEHPNFWSTGRIGSPS